MGFNTDGMTTYFYPNYPRKAINIKDYFSRRVEMNARLKELKGLLEELVVKV